jgi:hypothetical protein
MACGEVGPDADAVREGLVIVQIEKRFTAGFEREAAPGERLQRLSKVPWLRS